VVFFPFQFDIGPHVLGLFVRRIAAFAQAAVQPKLDRSIVRENKLKGFVSVIKGQCLRHIGLLLETAL
jgi:hypothetical protein